MHRSFLWLCVLLFCTCQIQEDNIVSYNTHIRPIFNKKCLACHGGIKQSGGFSLLFEKEAFADTQSGRPAIVRGSASQSELVNRLRHEDLELRMPLDSEPLSENEIKLIETWINQGAKWERHWAYIPPDTTISAPVILDTDWPINEIDHFVWQRLAQDSLVPNGPMEKAGLLRRLSLDLIGLPPSLLESKSYVQNADINAYEVEVDRLLNSPHFGEKWASMWMDLARYADSKGYEKDLYRSIWKYRDWLIQAFNSDMPFQQFTIEQLAGDLLPNPTESQLIATAFHRNPMANDEGGTDDEEYRNYANIERVGTTFDVWQGTTMACVQCHSHPYDPFKHEDFYNFLSFYNNTADKDIYHEAPNLFTYEGDNKEDVREIIAWIQKELKPEDQIKIEGHLYEQKTDLVNHLGYRKVEIESFAASGGFIELLAPDQTAIFQVQDSSWLLFENTNLIDVEAISYRYATPHGGFIEVHLDSLNGEKISQFSLPLTHNSKSKNQNPWEKWSTLKVPIEASDGFRDIYLLFRKDKIADADLMRLDWLYFHERSPKMATYPEMFKKKIKDLSKIPSVSTPILQELPPEKRRKNYLFDRGNWLAKTKEVKEAIPETLGKLPKDMPPDRLAMAQWLVSPDNPLTARVIVNRIWEQLMGYGIIESLGDFGTQSLPPSHPELLDWLAVQFTEVHQGSIKQLIKQIVLSASYRQSNTVTPEKVEVDPRNRLVSRGPRIRLSAEQMRDQILAVSDLLNPKMFGPSVQPPRPKGTDQFRFGDVYSKSEVEQQTRRSLYTYVKRTNPFPNQITFDGTDRTICSGRRIRTNTPLQALALLNDPVYMKAAKQLGKYMDTLTVNTIKERLAAGYQKVMLRTPHANKVNELLTLYTVAKTHYETEMDLARDLVQEQSNENEQLAALTMVAHSLLNLDEFVNN